MRGDKLSDITVERINKYPKTINLDGCWIPINKPTSAGYVPIQIEGISYTLHRLVVSIYYNLNYHDQSWDARHSTGCSKACFFHEHLQPGTISDNVKDQVRDGIHHHTRKNVCPKCGSIYRTRITKMGWSRGKTYRYCPVCTAIKNSNRYK